MPAHARRTSSPTTTTITAVAVLLVTLGHANAASGTTPADAARPTPTPTPTSVPASGAALPRADTPATATAPADAFADASATSPATAPVPAADRRAILGMAGTFRVQFDFRETVAVAPGYTPTEPYHAEAFELVVVLADEPDFISLQHVLVVDAAGDRPIVVKHWRQDWRYEDREVLRFVGHDRWVREHLPMDEVRGTWSQSVHQTTDAPRYEAIGRWTHEGERSSWESVDTWRPLPRREHTVRDDYQVVGCRNRHTITPDGWVHEQDNRKLQVDASGVVTGCLVHEIGINRYERCDPALLAPGATYWSEHAAAWAEIRDAWARVLDRDEVAMDPDAGPPLPRLIDVALENPDVRRTLVDRLERVIRG